MVAENTRNRHSGGPKALNQRSRQRVSWAVYGRYGLGLRQGLEQKMG